MCSWMYIHVCLHYLQQQGLHYFILALMLWNEGFVMDFYSKDPQSSDPSLHCRLFLRVFQTLQTSYKLATFLNACWRKPMKLLKVLWRGTIVDRYESSSVIWIEEWHLHSNRKSRHVQRWKYLNTAHTFWGYFWGNDIQNVRHSWCHNLLLGGLGLCVELTKHGGTQWSDWMGTFPIKGLKEVLTNSATLSKATFHMHMWNSAPKSGFPLPESMVSHALWYFCTYLPYLPLFGWPTRMLPI